MPELKQRKKSQKLNDDGSETTSSCKDETEKAKKEAGSYAGANKTSSSLDIKSIMCLLSLAACGALSWMVLQHQERFTDMEEKFISLKGKTAALFDMEEEVLKVSKKCESVQLMLELLGAQRGGLRPQLEGLEQDVMRLKEWASGLSEKRDQLQTSLTSLKDAVGQIDERTSAIAKDFASKVASVRTDVRRMDGLQSELESLLAQLTELEDKTAQVESSMVKRIGDVLASSIERVSNLRAASERNTQAIEKLRKLVLELSVADASISERLRELESGRARFIRTATFAADLKPKVAAIKKDFGAFEPQLVDLTVRIGRLAEELMEREQEMAEVRQTLANLTVVEGDLTVTTEQVREITDIGEMHQPT